MKAKIQIQIELPENMLEKGEQNITFEISDNILRAAYHFHMDQRKKIQEADLHGELVAQAYNYHGMWAGQILDIVSAGRCRVTPIKKKGK